VHNIEGDGFSAGIDHVCTVVMRACPQATPVVMIAKTAVKGIAFGFGKFVIDKIRNYRQRKKEARCTKNDHKKQEETGCFKVAQEPIIVHIYPIQDGNQDIGCRIIVPSEKQNISAPGCVSAAEETKNSSHIFPVVQNKEPMILLKQADTEVDSENKQYPGPWYDRTEDWIKEYPFGQKVAKHLERSKYTNQGKRAFRVINNIEGCDGFKKGDFVVIDALHKDHLEVFDKWKEWKGVANFDGTKNENKTAQGNNTPREPLRL